jgi:hypothetical protein
MATPCVPRADLCVYQGDDYSVIVVVSNPDGTPADLTGHTARAQIRRGPADTNETVDATITATIVSPNITLAMSHTETATLTSGGYAWDLELTYPSGVVKTILQGKVNVSLEVTR